LLITELSDINFIDQILSQGVVKVREKIQTIADSPQTLFAGKHLPKQGDRAQET